MEKLDEPGIYRRKDGRFVVRATAKCPDTGQMKESQRTLRAGKTLQDAIVLRDQLKVKLSTPQPVDLGPQITTVADYAERWLERKARRWKRSTYSKNEYALSWHILPSLGHLHIGRLTRRDVSDWVAHVENKRKDNGERYSTDTAQGWWRVLRNLLKDAYAQGYIDTDLTFRQDTPDTGVSGRQEQRTLSEEDLRRLVEAARTLQPHRYAEIATLAYTGMRIGELYGLQWEDIDGDCIHIRRSAHKAKVNSTKTGSTRTVPMVSLVAEAIQEHRETLIREQHPGLEAGIVFPSTTGGYRHVESIRKSLKLLEEHLQLDVHVSPQVMRRTFNTLLLRSHVDRITIRSMTGHSSERMTEHYAGIPMDMKRQAVGTLLGRSAATWDSGGGDTE